MDMSIFCTNGLIVIEIAFSFQVSKAQKPRKDLNPSRTKDAKGMMLTSSLYYAIAVPPLLFLEYELHCSFYSILRLLKLKIFSAIYKVMLGRKLDSIFLTCLLRGF